MVKLLDINNDSSGDLEDVLGNSSNQKVIGYPLSWARLTFLSYLLKLTVLVLD